MISEPVLVLTTGGTIDKAYFDALSEYQITDSVIAALLKEARVACPFRVVELIRKDSLDLTGALAPARFALSDAAFNLGMAFATAQVAAPGVWIAMSGQVFDGLRVRSESL